MKNLILHSLFILIILGGVYPVLWPILVSLPVCLCLM